MKKTMCLGLAALCVVVGQTAQAMESVPLEVAVMAVVPKKAFVGHPISIPVTTTNARTQEPISVPVAATLRDNLGRFLDMAVDVTDTSGRWTATLKVPDAQVGTYTVEIIAGGAGQILTGTVQIGELPVLFIETDKPIYKPGQTIHGRVLLLDAQLMPRIGEVVVQIQDAKGIKILRKD